ncbi:MAG: hypothetical protein ACKPKO_44515, partial [Candidatus Fonsibacter sp.]
PNFNILSHADECPTNRQATIAQGHLCCGSRIDTKLEIIGSVRVDNPSCVIYMRPSNIYICLIRGSNTKDKFNRRITIWRLTYITTLRCWYVRYSTCSCDC